jgi:hypothetical protein
MDQDPNASQRYLDELRRQLVRLPQAERDDAVKEIGSHIADARAAGMPLAAILGRLGQADALARAYEADYLLSRPLPPEALEPVTSGLGRVVRIVGPVLEVQQLLGNNTVRTVAMGPTEGLSRGMVVSNTGAVSPSTVKGRSLPKRTIRSIGRRRDWSSRQSSRACSKRASKSSI